MSTCFTREQCKKILLEVSQEATNHSENHIFYLESSLAPDLTTRFQFFSPVFQSGMTGFFVAAERFTMKKNFGVVRWWTGVSMLINDFNRKFPSKDSLDLTIRKQSNLMIPKLNAEILSLPFLVAVADPSSTILNLTTIPCIYVPGKSDSATIRKLGIPAQI